MLATTGLREGTRRGAGCARARSAVGLVACGGTGDRTDPVRPNLRAQRSMEDHGRRRGDDGYRGHPQGGPAGPGPLPGGRGSVPARPGRPARGPRAGALRQLRRRRLRQGVPAQLRPGARTGRGAAARHLPPRGQPRRCPRGGAGQGRRLPQALAWCPAGLDRLAPGRGRGGCRAGGAGDHRWSLPRPGRSGRAGRGATGHRGAGGGPGGGPGTERGGTGSRTRAGTGAGARARGCRPAPGLRVGVVDPGHRRRDPRARADDRPR